MLESETYLEKAQKGACPIEEVVGLQIEHDSHNVPFSKGSLTCGTMESLIMTKKCKSLYKRPR